MKIGGVSVGTASVKRTDEIDRPHNRFTDGEGNEFVRSLQAFTDLMVTYELERMTDAQKDALLAAVNASWESGSEVLIEEEDPASTSYTGTIHAKRFKVTRGLGSYWRASVTVRRVYS